VHPPRRCAFEFRGRSFPVPAPRAHVANLMNRTALFGVNICLFRKSVGLFSGATGTSFFFSFFEQEGQVVPAKIIRTYSLETLAPNMPYTLQCGVASGSKLSKTRFSSLFFFWFGLHEFVYPPVLLGVQGIGALSIRRNSDDNMPSTSTDSWTNPCRPAS